MVEAGSASSDHGSPAANDYKSKRPSAQYAADIYEQGLRCIG